MTEFSDVALALLLLHTLVVDCGVILSERFPVAHDRHLILDSQLGPERPRLNSHGPEYPPIGEAKGVREVHFKSLLDGVL